jgi:aspartate ammonia-lyase
MRYETDSLGTLPLPEELYYGINTERGRQNCEVSSST